MPVPGAAAHARASRRPGAKMPMTRLSESERDRQRKREMSEFGDHAACRLALELTAATALSWSLLHACSRYRQLAAAPYFGFHFPPILKRLFDIFRHVAGAVFGENFVGDEGFLRYASADGDDALAFAEQIRKDAGIGDGMEAWPSVTRKVVVRGAVADGVCTVPAWTMPPRRKERPGGGVLLQRPPWGPGNR